MAKQWSVLFCTFFLALVACLPTATASDTWSVHGGPSLVISRASEKPMSLVAGLNAVDQPHTFNCESDQCMVEFSPSIESDGNNNVWICGYIDGVPAPKPKCGVSEYNDIILDMRQRAIVSRGIHTVQTFMYSYNSDGHITGWVIDYTVYNLSAQTNDGD